MAARLVGGGPATRERTGWRSATARSTGRCSPRRALAAAEQRFYREDARAAVLTDALDRLADSVPDPRWDHLVTTLGLTPRDANLLALALAADAVPGMRRVFGYLQDDTAPADASPGLAAALWDWASAPRAPHRH